METPRYKWRPYNIFLLIFASLIIVIIVSIPNHLDRQLVDVNHDTDSAAINDSLTLPPSDPFDLDRLSEKSEIEIKSWYYQTEFLLQMYEDMPKAKQEIDSVRQEAKKRFLITLP